MRQARVIATLFAALLAWHPGTATAAGRKATADKPETSARTPERISDTPSPPAVDADALPNLDFDLLGDLPPPAPVQEVDVEAVKQRRFMLTLHQNLGIALVVGMTGSMVTGQLNYNDKFLGGNSGQYQFPHQLFVYPTVAIAAVAAGLALFVPHPIATTGDGSFDRNTLHKVGEYIAGIGWLAQIGLGLLTSFYEGYFNQGTLAGVHLAAGYVTLTGMLIGVGSIVL